MKQDHLMMNVAPDQTIILSLQIFLDYRSLSSIDKKILMTPPDISRSFEVVWMSSESYSSSFVLSSFCLSVSVSMLQLSKVPLDGAHVILGH